MKKDLESKEDSDVSAENDIPYESENNEKYEPENVEVKDLAEDTEYEEDEVTKKQKIKLKLINSSKNMGIYVKQYNMQQ